MELEKILTQDMSLSKDSLLGKVAVVTGSGRGIGFQLARGFAILGACVVIAELDGQSGNQAAQAILDMGRKSRFIQTDVSNVDSVKNLREEVRRTYGEVDILVNNAILCPVVSVMDMSPVEWDRVVSVNLRGTFLMCKQFLPDMLAKRSGTILNMISTDAMPGLSAYIATKQGITGFSQSLALELNGSGVHVIPFGPGMVDTPGIRAVSSDLAPRLGLTSEQFLGASLHPAYDGLMPPEHAAAAAVYLTLRMAVEVNGQVINGYEVLERAGIIQAAEIEIIEEKKAVTPAAVAVLDRKQAQMEFRSLLGGLHKVIEESEGEFNRLPLFVRPIARGGFKNKSGLSMEDWKRTLNGWLERLGSTGSEPQNDQALFLKELALLNARLGKLSAYFKSVPAETARMTKDQAFLQEVSRIATERVALIGRLRDILAALMS